MNHTCIICKDKFQLSKAEVRMIEAGEVSAQDINICDDCADREAESYDFSYEQYSDADPGL